MERRPLDGRDKYSSCQPPRRQRVTLSVSVRLKGNSGPVKGTLVGRAGGTGVPKGMKFVAHSQTFPPGDSVVKVESLQRLSKQIQKVQFNVGWQVVGPGLLAIPIISSGRCYWRKSFSRGTSCS